MATITESTTDAGSSRKPGSVGRAIDRWIYVYMAASFVIVVLAGFIPDSLMMLADVKAGLRPPIPLILHVHALLMGAFLTLMLAQTTLAAFGRWDAHRRTGRSALLLVPAIVLVGFVLVPLRYHGLWDATQAAAPATRAELQQVVLLLDNILLVQLRIGILFALFAFLGLRARATDGAFHKRMMILAAATPLPAAINRIPWLPMTLPHSPLSADLYLLALVSPLLVWDIVRTQRIHRAYLLWLGLYGAMSVAVYGLWGTGWWYTAAPRLMGV